METVNADRVEGVEALEKLEENEERSVRSAPIDQPVARTWKEVLKREVRTHPFGYGVLAVALVAGPVLIRMIFPEVTMIQSIVGGLAFGVYLALCAVPQKFM